MYGVFWEQVKEPPLAELYMCGELLQDCSYNALIMHSWLCIHVIVYHGSWEEEDVGGHTMCVLPGTGGMKVWWRLERRPGEKGHKDLCIE